MASEILAAAREYGLDPLPTLFELVSHDEMNQIAAYGGFPTRYPHWRFGMEYEELCKGYTYGLQKIYELVVNNEPCYAYLMGSNSAVDQKMVIAHVYAHSDFFKNNLWFRSTNRRMMDEMANHGTRIRRYIERYGLETVEVFLDAALSLENLLDFHSVLDTAQPRVRFDFSDAAEPERPVVPKLPSKGYMDRFINPPEVLEKQRRKIEEEMARKKRFPARPQKDVLGFLIEYAPLENWQRDVLAIVREEAYYFAPQAMTKVMNEGWAAYWHAKILTERVLHDEEVVDYAEHHAGVLGGGGLNPYKLGMELFRDIEDRWNKGRFGPDWERCDDAERRRTWDLALGRGREKIFEVRKIYNDVTFIDEFLTPEFCAEHKLFAYEYNPHANRYEISSRDFADIKRNLLARLTNLGHPVIRIVDGNHRNRAELLLAHEHDGADLDLEEARDALRNLFRIWQRPVHLDTVVEGTPRRLSFDGEKHSDSTPD
jgi:stage V sporulation protein R